jgi:hypothetical protein
MQVPQGSALVVFTLADGVELELAVLVKPNEGLVLVWDKLSESTLYTINKVLGTDIPMSAQPVAQLKQDEEYVYNGTRIFKVVTFEKLSDSTMEQLPHEKRIIAIARGKNCVRLARYTLKAELVA